MWHLTAFLVLALPASVLAQQGRLCGKGLFRNSYQCDRRFTDEVCVRGQNSLSRVMDCVVTDDPWLCTNSPSGQYFSSLQQYYPRGGDCVNPYDILMNGVLDVKCQGCSLYGILDLCMKNLDGDDFRSCVCHHAHTAQAWPHLNSCFYQPHGQALYTIQCGNGLWRKRGESERVYERIPEGVNKTATFDPSSPLVNDSGTLNAKRQNDAGDPNNPDPYQVIDDAGYQFQIDDYGQPNYVNGFIGMSLPYYQELFFDNTVVQRCYIMPFSSNLFCLRWQLPERVEDDPTIYQGPYKSAKYGSQQYQSNVNLSIPPTGTQAPLVPSSTSIAWDPEFNTGDVSATTGTLTQPSVSVAPVPSTTSGTAGSAGSASPTTSQGKNSAVTAAPAAAGIVAAVGAQLVLAAYQNL